MAIERVSDERPTSGGQPNQSGGRSDAELLDAYSTAVIDVVGATLPSVVTVAGTTGRGGSGSGFLVQPDGLAVTNSHVVGGRSELTATTAEGDRLPARVLGDDPETDVAVLRIAGTDLPTTRLGDSAALQLGQLVIAIGSPLGLQSTVSTGVVGGLGRSMRGYEGRLIENVVQHSAPINPGNSGGPLLDSRGRVVGVNTATVAMAEGLGFAVPANTVEWVLTEILEHGEVRRRRVGIVGSTVVLPRQLSRSLDLLGDHAVQVVEVSTSGAGHRAGLRPGDLIVGLAGRIVESVDDLHRLLTRVADETVEVEIVRDGRLTVLALPAG